MLLFMAEPTRIVLDDQYSDASGTERIYCKISYKLRGMLCSVLLSFSEEKGSAS